MNSDDTADRVPETRPSIRNRASRPRTDPYLVHIYPTGPTIGRKYAVKTGTLVLGRSTNCDIRIDHQSVSRQHARIESSASGYYAVDLDSTNGTFVNDTLTHEARLRDGDYLRIGDCIFRFLNGDNVETEYHEELYRLTIIDGLTGVANKRYFLEFLDRELQRANRYQRPLSLIMFDIDNFKAFNDQMGHLAGDATLRELSHRLAGRLRNEDLMARYGGEEFGMVLVETPHVQAQFVAERTRQAVEEHPFHYESRSYQVTVSLGVASTTGTEGWTVEDLIRQADDKLYQAKRAGRNCVMA